MPNIYTFPGLPCCYRCRTTLRSLSYKQQWCVDATVLVMSFKKESFCLHCFHFPLFEGQKVMLINQLELGRLVNIKNTTENGSLGSLGTPHQAESLTCTEHLSIWEVLSDRYTFFWGEGELHKIKWTILKCQFSGI